MLNKKISTKIVLIMIMLAAVFTACKTTSKSMSKDDMMMGGNEFMAWKGEWVSADIVKNDPSFKATYMKTAEQMSHYTAEGLEAAALDLYSSPVLKAKFDGTNKVIFTVMDNAAKKEIQIVCMYKHTGKKADMEYPDSMWETFELINETSENSSFKYVVMLPPHAHGDVPTHWHARFGGRSIDRLLAAKGKWPTFYDAATPKKALVKRFEDSISNMPKWLPKSPFESYSEKGRWINRLAVYDNTSKEVEAVYAKVIKEFAGKNPKGGDFTKAEIIAELKKGDDSLNDFTHFDFITKDGKNEMVVLKNGKEIFRSGYKRVAANLAKPFITFKADKKNAGKFTIISFTSVHGDPAHFHLWYGATGEELGAMDGAPTCIIDTKSNANIASMIERNCNRKLKMLTKMK